MIYIQLKTAVFSIIEENDPHKATKKLYLKNWCRAFIILLNNLDQESLPFFLDVLSDDECWIATDTIHRIQLDRRKVAQKMIELQSWRGITNPFDNIDRLRIACWCCIEENLLPLIEIVKIEHKITDNNRTSIGKLLSLLKTGALSDQLTHYWLHVVGGYVSSLQLEGRHFYEYGIYTALDMDGHRGKLENFTRYVEALEFFWHKINMIPGPILTPEQKTNVFMRTTLYVTKKRCANNPELLEFCIDQLNPVKSFEFLGEDRCFRSFNLLQYNRRFDLIKKLFDCFKPGTITEKNFHKLLHMLIQFEVEKYSQFYADEVIKLFMHIWMKEGFDNHRSFVLTEEIYGTKLEVNILESLVEKNCVDSLWIMLEQLNHDQKRIFMESRQGHIIRSIFEAKKDHDSLKKLLNI